MQEEHWLDDMPAESWCGPDYRERTPGRLAHLVYLDGELVDCWTESPFGTQYACRAHEKDAESRRLVQPPAPVVPAPPPEPAWERALRWLDNLVGGRGALLALGLDPLEPAAPIVLDELPLGQRHRVEAVTRLLVPLDDVIGVEPATATRRLLAQVWACDPQAITGAATAAHAAAGLIWVAGRANDVFGQHGLSQTAVKEKLSLSVPLSSYGRTIHRAIVGFVDEERPPAGQADLLATGRPDLLVRRTRLRLVRLRDQALAARDLAQSAGGADRLPLLP